MWTAKPSNYGRISLVRRPFGLMPKYTVELQQLVALMVLYVTKREMHSGSCLGNKKKIVE